MQLARAWQLVGRGAGVAGAGGLAATRDGAFLARSSIMSPPRRDGGGGSGDGSGERALTDMVLALQLRVGELDCEVLKVRWTSRRHVLAEGVGFGSEILGQTVGARLGGAARYISDDICMICINVGVDHSHNDIYISVYIFCTTPSL